jgi:hypothetical protein
MPHSLPIPDRPADLTPAWLTAALSAGNAIDHSAVTAFTVETAGGDGGLYGQTVRVRLIYDQPEAGAPPSLIAKFSAVSKEMRERAIGSYEREIRFYRELASHSALPVPTCYYADIDPASHRHILLLEDMAPAVSGSRLTGCTAAQAALAVRHIAAFHAAWWEHPALSALDWLPDPDFGDDPGASQRQYESWWPRFLENLGDAPLPEPILAMGKRFGSHRAAIEHHLFNAPPRTLLHGDFHLGNLVFASAGSGTPFAVLDWQMLRRGRAVRDVAYFLSENLLPDVRQKVEGPLLKEYHRGLVEGGVSGYTIEDCLTDYRLALLQRFRALVSTIAVMPFTPAERQMHVDVLLPRNIAAILDMDADFTDLD